MTVKRLKFEVWGIVQGVGFRPFVYRLAKRYELHGFVRNTSWGVLIEVEGDDRNLRSFGTALEEETPPLAVVAEVLHEETPPLGERGFRILDSVTGQSRLLISPDSDVCSDCLRELFDPADR